MANEQTPEGTSEGDGKKKSSGFMTQLLLAVALGAAAFATVYFLPGSEPPVMTCEAEAPKEVVKKEPEPPSLEHVTFVALEPLMVSLGTSSEGRHLKIGLTLETSEGHEYDIEHAEPKLRDAFTGYLRAVSIDQLEDPAAMVRLRAQLLRRAKVILGKDTVQGVLITDFIVR
jgi:flagellar FliL protein